MRSLDSKKVFIAVIVILTLINMGFVMSVILMQRQSKASIDGLPTKIVESPGHFMMNEVGFSEEQLKVFQTSRQEFRNKMEPLHMELRDLKHQLVTEATSQHPDTSICNMLSEKIGMVHAELNRETSMHLMKVRNIATPEQSLKLKEFYIHMFNAGPEEGQGRGRQYRHRGQRQHVTD